jgi:DnaJ like chaperone protein
MLDRARISIWTRINEAVAALGRGEALSAIFDRLRGVPPAAPERSVGFTIAVIALAAKMAKADGHVSVGEVSVFRRIFTIPPGEEANAARVFDLARQDVAGYDAYARKIAAMFDEPGHQVLIDLLEGLARIALADGAIHPAEEAFLAEVAGIFGLAAADWRSVRARVVAPGSCDPFEVLGLPCGAPVEEARKAWKAAVRETHPDRLAARGLPPEAVRLGEERLIAVNRAWDTIRGRDAA